MNLRPFTFIILCLAGLSILQAQPISFLPPVSVGIGDLHFPILANSLAVADFNGDGKADLLAVGHTNDGLWYPLTVSLGNGDGTFQPALTIIPSTTLYSPVIADFNSDGNQDVAVIENVNDFTIPAGLSAGYYLVVLLGKGDGTFRTPLTTALPSSLTNLITADFNHDGHSDLIAGQTVLLGNGDGTFRALPTPLTAPAALAADFNRDGKLDVLLTQASGQLAVALGAGDGTFGTRMAIASPFVPGTLVAGDFNGDGLLDLAISPTTPLSCILSCTNPIVSIGVLTGNGDGTFQPAILTANSMGPIFAAADMNRDGKLDLLVGNSILAGVGDGTFRFPAFYGLTTKGCSPSPQGTCLVASDSAAVVADFNGDGRNDIAEALFAEDVVSVRSNSVAVLLNDSPGDGFLVAGVSSPSYKWPTGATSIVTAFGTNLATSTASAPNAAAPPTSLGGIRVHLLDRVSGNDRLAQLFYVSPTQINFEISTADTFVYVSIEHVGSPYIPKGMIIPVQPLQPDLFNAETAVQAASGAVTSVSVSPINVSSGSVYLSLYGTGFDSVSTAKVNCSIGSVNVQPTYSGPQLQIPGLDQINLLLPSSLAGVGSTSVKCVFVTGGAATAAANPVSITIQ